MAVGAKPFGFDDCPLNLKARTMGGGTQFGFELICVCFAHGTAFTANQKYGCMFCPQMRTGDIGVEPFDFMGKTGGNQKVERAVISTIS